MRNLHTSIRRSFLLFFILCAAATTAVAQVGINTTTPRTTLEVAGDMNINGNFKINQLDNVQDDNNSSFLTQIPNGSIKELNALEGEGLVIAYFQEYRLKNMDGDWVKEFETNIPASKYVIVIISTYFNQGLQMETSQSSNFSIPYCSAYIGGNPGTWKITADYAGAKPVGSAPGEWVISTLILSKEFSKILNPEQVPMNGLRGGVKDGPPIID